MIGRRTFVGLLLSGLATPLAAEAQRGAKVPTVGFLCARPGPSSHTRMFELGMRELGYVAGKDILIDYRFMPADGIDPFPRFARDLVARKVDVIVVGSPLALLPAKRATSAIPLVMAQSDDPVAAGLVATLARPGGNITGLSSMSFDLSVKQLELLKALAPRVLRIAVLWNRASAVAQPLLRRLEQAAKDVGVAVLPFPVRADAREIDEAFAAITKQRAEALIVLPDMAFFDHLEQFVRLAAKQRLPTIYGEREFVDAGGLISYGTNYDELFRRAATYVDRILKGAKPGDLPIEQPTRFELVIGVKTGKAVGLTIPPSLLVRADEVIE